MEILDNKASQFLNLLAVMQGALHPPAEESQAAGATTQVLAPAFPLETSYHAEPDQEENVPPSQSEDAMQEENVPTQPEDTMQLDGTPVEEETTPLGDSTINAFFLDVWLHYIPYQ
jgi:hypothetical protein